jgi:amino acid transporter
MRPRRKSAPKVGVVGLIALTFFTVSGGPYGLEPIVRSFGGHLALVAILLVPLVWSLPVALAVAELTTMMPLSGGYYRWVQFGMGDFWGFQEGWWSWLFTFVDMALYPVLAADILAQAWPLVNHGHALSPLARVAFLLGFIWISAAINWMGAAFVADYSIVTMVLVLAPFAPLIWRGLSVAGRHAPGTAAAHGAVGVALAAVVWNYTGWDNVSTFATQVDKPRRTYPLGLLAALVLITAGYALAVGAGARLDPNRLNWGDGYFVTLGGVAAGPMLAIVMTITAIVSSWGQYTGQLVYVLPLPENLARDGYLPRVLAKEDRRQVPVIALLFSSVLYSALSLISFDRLLVADTLLYGAGLALELLTLLMLRRDRPEMARPFLVPLRGASLAAFCIVPMAVSLASLIFAARAEPGSIVAGIILLASGPAFYFVSGFWRTSRTRVMGR